MIFDGFVFYKQVAAVYFQHRFSAPSQAGRVLLKELRKAFVMVLLCHSSEV